MSLKFLKKTKKARVKKAALILTPREWAVRFVVAALLIGFFSGFFIRYFKVDEWRSFDAELITKADRSVLVYDARGELIAVASSGQKRIPIEIEALSDATKYAFISAEDARFYEHSGLDIIRIFGAAWADIKAMRLDQGASTIGQQLIKLSHLSSKKSFERKLEEAYLTTLMERMFSKDEILEMYLNFVYFGSGFYGIEAASLGYFGLHASEISVAQAAQLAGILKSPSAYAPHLNMEKSLGRRNTVLELMKSYGHITSAEYEAAIAEKCLLKNAIPEVSSAAVSYALGEAASLVGVEPDGFLRSGCRVYTTIDSRASELSDALMRRDALFPSENSEAALVLLGSGGEILAMNGSRGEYMRGSLNRAVNMQRQPGSLIKPLLCYAPAIEEGGYTAASILDDSEKSFDGYAPKNAGESYHGFVTLREAVAESMNVPAVELFASVGVERCVSFAKKLGISFENEHIGLPAALGGFTYGCSPVEIAAAYNAFSAGGVYSEPYAVTRVELNGETLYEHQNTGVRVMSRENAYIMTSVLESAAESGTAKALSELGFPIAAKTGTNLTSDGSVRDVWTAAYSGGRTAVIWLGTDSAALGSLPDGTTGGNCACIFMRELFRELGGAPAERPDGVLLCRLDKTALEREHIPRLASSYTPDDESVFEYFSASTAPTAYSEFWLPPAAPSPVFWTMDANGNPIIRFNASDERLKYRIIRTGGEGGERVVAELTGQRGEAAYTDFTVLAGNTYVYYVKAVNPFIILDGAPAESEPSRGLRVFVLF